MISAAHDRLIDINITIPDFQVVTAIRIGANPSLIADRSPLTTEVRQGH